MTDTIARPDFRPRLRAIPDADPLQVARGALTQAVKDLQGAFAYMDGAAMSDLPGASELTREEVSLHAGRVVLHAMEVVRLAGGSGGEAA